ncbi:MAG: ATP synthase F1 subunit gamma [Elusimicrobia bacterium CG06_land_8_20_14_3_00_38_11]|nr:MAG: ATP synthase F1 subunit gamma [Elusimicrobia bacterium CG06_land_8_20_14_3_00_38_11]
MATLKEIRKKIKTTQSIQKTTKAMQMIAAARFQKAQHQVISSRPYALKIHHLLSDMLKKTAAKPLVHPFLSGGTSNREGILVITSDKGLCGAYNTNIMKNAFEFIRSKNITDLEIFVIGKKGRDYFKRNGLVIKHEYFDMFKNFSAVKAEIITDEIIKSFLQDKLKKFSIMHAEYKSIFYQPIAMKQLLPIENRTTDTEQNAEQTRNSSNSVPSEVPVRFRVMFDYIYEPSGKIIVDKLFNRYLKSEVFKILTEAYTSEVATRQNSMENANKNSTEIISELSLVMNKLRQQQITTELTEIMGASE